MKKSILILGIICLTVVAKAQESTDYGLITALGMEHQSTILPVPTTTVFSLSPTIGGFYRKNFNPRYGLRIGASYSLNQPYFTYVSVRQLPLFPGVTGLDQALLPIDLHALIEFNFLPLNPKFDKPKVSTFVAAGLAMFQLRPAIPFTVGVRYRVTERFGVSADWNIRRKIGGNISPAALGEPSSNWFSFVGVTANYNILKTCKTCPFYESSRKKQ